MKCLPPSALLWPLIAVACCLPSCRPAADSVKDQGRKTTAAQQPVAYVGHETCAECHSDIAASHALSGHARTFALTKDLDVAQRLCGTTRTLSQPYGRYEYTCDAEGVMVAIPERFGNRAFPLEYAVGSGDHAITFLTLLPDPSGETVGIEHRLTWYRSDEAFDITPGHDDLVPSRDAEFFGRVFPQDKSEACIDCHTTSAVLEGTRLTSLYSGVHCEECHGSGVKHVQAARDGTDLRGTIVRAGSAAEQMEQCGRCHRTANDITAERLAEYPRSVIRFQPVGLSKSRCFLETEGGLRCSHCHDPHSPVTSRSLNDQVATCIECHSGTEQTRCPVSPAADCIRCHMPPIDLVRGIAFHDHWIRVRKADDIAPATPRDADHATTR